MKEIVQFFWERYRRAICMDMANKIRGASTHNWIEADDWISAYKKTLSKSKAAEFDKIWNNLEKQLKEYQEGKKGAVNPMPM